MSTPDPLSSSPEAVTPLTQAAPTSQQDLTSESSQGSSSVEAPSAPTDTHPDAPAEPPPSYVKLAMRNMVRKGGKSLFHFALTVTALLSLLVGLAYLTR